MYRFQDRCLRPRIFMEVEKQLFTCKGPSFTNCAHYAHKCVFIFDRKRTEHDSSSSEHNYLNVSPAIVGQFISHRYYDIFCACVQIMILSIFFVHSVCRHWRSALPRRTSINKIVHAPASFGCFATHFFREPYSTITTFVSKLSALSC